MKRNSFKESGSLKELASLGAHSFLFLAVFSLMEMESEKESRKKISEVVGASSFFRNVVCGYWRYRYDCSTRGDQWDFPVSCKRKQKAPKCCWQVCALKEEEDENNDTISF